MRTSWQIETGHPECRWSEVGQRVQYDPTWMRETSEVQSRCLLAVPDFASHSPFGGATWFYRHSADRNSE